MLHRFYPYKVTCHTFVTGFSDYLWPLMRIDDVHHMIIWFIFAIFLLPSSGLKNFQHIKMSASTSTSSKSSSPQVMGDTLEYKVKKKLEEINAIVHGSKWVLSCWICCIVRCLHRVTYYIGISQVHSVVSDIYLRKEAEGYVPCSHISRETAFIWFHGNSWSGYTCYYRFMLAVEPWLSLGTCIQWSRCVLWWQPV